MVNRTNPTYNTKSRTHSVTCFASLCVHSDATNIAGRQCIQEQTRQVTNAENGYKKVLLR